MSSDKINIEIHSTCTVCSRWKQMLQIVQHTANRSSHYTDYTDRCATKENRLWKEIETLCNVLEKLRRAIIIIIIVSAPPAWLLCLSTCNSHTFRWADARANIAPCNMTRREYTNPCIRGVLMTCWKDGWYTYVVHTNATRNHAGERVCVVCTIRVNVSAGTTNPCECMKNMKAFPSDNVESSNWLCVAYGADTLHNKLHRIAMANEKKMRFDCFACSKNAVIYADKPKRNASSIFFELANMTQGFEFRWCIDTIIIAFVGGTHSFWLIPVRRMHAHHFTPCGNERIGRRLKFQ